MTESRSSLPVPLKKIRALGPERFVRVACYLSLFAMALMCWSVLDPTPFPVMVAMSAGQVVGTLGLACYLGAILAHALRRRPTSTPPSPPSA
jgi:hypothetical protein